MKISDNQEFIASARWRCEKSPGGAHHWIINGYQMTCKYCNMTKPVNANPQQLSRPETG
jgi:hypothetical protein